nr:MAG TPA: hypothetical protein [Bacteriophage sp.]
MKTVVFMEWKICVFRNCCTIKKTYMKLVMDFVED